MSKREVEFWLDFGSNYSYIAAMRAETLADRFGVKVQWRPFMLGPIFEDIGWRAAPFVQQELKGAYVWKDMVRQCEKYGVAWSKKPSTFPRPAVYTMRVAAAFSTEEWVGEYCGRVMTLNFVDDRDIHSNEVAVEVLNQMGLPGVGIVQAAQAEPNKSRLREFSAQAKELGIFGAPTFFVRGEMFWGNDRLEDALAFAVRE
jgi:2-hydroxychromene-2-carboxylate isomerase